MASIRSGHHGTVPRPASSKAASTASEPEWAGYASPVRELVVLNAVLAFLLELAILVFVAWWALLLDAPWWARILLAFVLVAAIVVLWGAFAAPRARVRLPIVGVGVVAVKVFVFGAGALALWGLGFPTAAVVFAVVAAVNLVITTVVRARAV